MNASGDNVVDTVRAELAYTRADEVLAERDRGGTRRARSRPLDTDFEQQFQRHSCQLRDWSAPGSATPSLQAMGFEPVDLSRNRDLQEVLADVRRAGRISDDQIRLVRRSLRGNRFVLANGARLQLLHVAHEGMIVRRGGPAGLDPDPQAPMSGANNHRVASAVHADQDVCGTPLKQLARGAAPWLFRHQSPYRRNLLSPLVLVNLWVPLQQVTQPLALMDRRSLNPREHQLRYALPVESFLERDEDARFNDIWAFLHDPGQQWYFSADMGPDRAYVFDTLGEPHGACSLPGEEVAAHYYRLLQEQVRCVEQGQACPSLPAAPELPAATTAPLRRAIARMAQSAARAPTPGTAAQAIAAWREQALVALDAVVRKSLEMRVVALLLPPWWPFRREPVPAGAATP